MTYHLHKISILVVEDNSPDGTAAIVKELMEKYPESVHIHERTGKQGLGTAYIAGFKWAIEHNYDYIFEMDADFSHNPNDLVHLHEACTTGADVAIGSRYVSGVNVVNWPMGRVLMSYYASAYVRMVTGMSIRDTTAGFKCYRKIVLETIDFDKIRYYLSDGQKPKRSWDEVPAEVLETFERLGVPEQERAFLAGVEAQYDSEAAYSNVKEELEKEKKELKTEPYNLLLFS